MFKKFLTWCLFLSMTLSFSAAGDSNAKSIELARFEHYAASLYANIDLEKYGLSYEAFRYALMGYLNLENAGKLDNRKVLTIIDYSQSSKHDRFLCINLEQQKLVFHTLVAHGANSGMEYPHYFSNRVNSHQSSIGFFITKNTYVGQNGYSLALEGEDAGFNSNALKRSLVIHQADYVRHDLASTGMIGRSWGCPAIPADIYQQVINYLKGGTCVFAYYHSEKYLKNSKYLNPEIAAQSLLKSGIYHSQLLNP